MTEIKICLGSSCFARGNKQTVRIISDYLKEHNLEDSVIFHGEHCTGNCEKGPIIKVDDEIYENIMPDEVIDFLDKIFK
ncbi:MAG: NAD(P)H-dependent oxidoreductase subunit E [Bacteroidales bacterium]|nr:NAD(P)H-dependent oxidoreductase subunit E [Bacteroidales bacterium]